MLSSQGKGAGVVKTGAKNYFIYFVLLVKKNYKFREIILV